MGLYLASVGLLSIYHSQLLTPNRSYSVPSDNSRISGWAMGMHVGTVSLLLAGWQDFEISIAVRFTH